MATTARNSAAFSERETYRFLDISAIHARAGQAHEPLPKARPSADSVLTALAQLALLRLKAHRAFISLFDRQTQYFIAETTAAHGLRSDANRDTEEGLLYCGIACPRGNGVSDHVIDLAIESLTSTVEAEASSRWQAPIVIIPDVQSDERFRARRFVAENYDVRFYCGVALRSPNGPVIGVVSISDEQPRSALNEVEEAFLRETSATIMEYLAASRAKRELVRSTRMVRGLGSFVEGGTTTTGLPIVLRNPESAVEPENEGALNSAQQERIHRSPPAEDGDESTSVSDSYFPRDLPPRSDGNRKPSQHEPLPPKARSSPSSFIPGARPVTHDKAHGLADHGSTTSTPSLQQAGFGHLFSKASNLIRESIEVEGVFFFDARKKFVEGSVQTGKPTDNGTGALSSSHSSSSGEEVYQTMSQTFSASTETNCDILGFSTTAASSIDNERPADGFLTVPERFLRVILRRYPEGRIFNFNEEGSLVSDTESDVDQNSFIAAKGVDLEGEAKLHKKPARPYSRANEASLIVKMFPGATSVIIFPLWDFQKERWFAGGVVWTRATHRVLSVRNELSFLRAFGAIIMTEVAKLEAQKTDQAKTDVLGSISHEIRSPLHGILGFVEVLQNTDVDVFQASAIQTLETCGLTLLDTVDHLLDYAKINNLLRSEKQAHHKRIKGAPRHEAIHSIVAGKLEQSLHIDVAAIVEEVVESVTAGYGFRKSIGQQTDAHNDDWKSPFGKGRPSFPHAKDRRLLTSEFLGQHLTLILDIKPAENWVFACQAGALRRIIMNVYGNALKYTDEGHIKVIVGQETMTSPTNRSTSMIQIKIEDTGKGIGREYLSHRLFKAFSQEDSLSPGTGLGLSITHQIVTSLGGNINIQSQVNNGTVVTITLPLTRPNALEPSHRQDPLIAQSKRTTALRLALLGFEDDRTPVPVSVEKNTTPWRPPRSPIESVCQNWLHMEVLQTNRTSVTPDIFIATPVAAELLAQREGSNTVIQPVLVVCPNASAAPELVQITKKRWSHGIFEFLPQPYGPRKLAKIITLCLDRWADFQITRSGRTTSSYISSNPPETLSRQQSLNLQNLSLHNHAEELGNTQTSMTAQTQPNPLALTLPPPSTADKSGTSRRPASFLIVDDNAINLKLLAAYLRKRHLSFTTAVDGMLAVEAYQAAQGAFKAVLMDIQMPRMDGLTATRKIREYERHNNLPPVTVIVLTGLASHEKKQEAEAHGVDIFLSKPVRFKELDKIMENLK